MIGCGYFERLGTLEIALYSGNMELLFEHVQPDGFRSCHYCHG